MGGSASSVVISFLVREKSKTERFCLILSGWEDLGMGRMPCWISQRRDIWAAVFQWASAMEEIAASTAMVMRPRGAQASTTIPLD